MNVTTCGIDLAKNLFQVHGVDSHGKVVVKKQLRRDQVAEFFANLPSCLIGMEACSGAHHLARKLTALGHTVKLMAAKFVKPYVKSNKNDAADAEAICEAVGRSNMRFVPVKNVEQQAALSLHRRDGAPPRSLQAVADEAVRRAYTDAANPLRATMVGDPLGARRNTRDNTPAVVHCELVEGDALEVLVVAKGGGGDVKARFATLNPSDDVADWVLAQLPGLGAGWCPPGIVGLGIGGTPEQAMLLAKLSLFEPIDIDLLRARGAATPEEALRLDLHARINALGIGAQGLGGLSTVLDVKVRTASCHAATLPVALVPDCAATRWMRFTLDGSGPARIEPPPADTWDGIPDRFDVADARRVDLERLDRAEVARWRAGEVLLLSGRVLTARDAAHKRLADLLAQGLPLPVELRDRVVYYVGPVDAVAGEAVGPAGPTTATRMDRFVEPLLAHTGLLAMIGKAERGPQAVEAIARHGAAYLAATGGAAYLLSRSIRSARVLAFADLGMEAIHEFELADFPVMVAVDAQGTSIHRFKPAPIRLVQA